MIAIYGCLYLQFKAIGVNLYDYKNLNDLVALLIIWTIIVMRQHWKELMPFTQNCFEMHN